MKVNISPPPVTILSRLKIESKIVFEISVPTLGYISALLQVLIRKLPLFRCDLENKRQGQCQGEILSLSAKLCRSHYG